MTRIAILVVATLAAAWFVYRAFGIAWLILAAALFAGGSALAIRDIRRRP